LQQTTKTTSLIFSTIYAALVAFCLYTCVFAFRKAFNVAAFEGYHLFGLDYKVVLVITQVAGYMLSKFYGIKFISELKHFGRGKLILLLVGIAWLAWLVFALLPPPYNFWILFFNGFPLGIIWGIVFSYVEGRRTTDVISAALAVSFIFASGVAKSVALWLMQRFHITEYWMPFATGAVFFPPLILLIYLIEQLPPPSAEDNAQRTKRHPMMAAERKQFRNTYFVGIVALVIIYVLVTILREVRDSFMADMWRESGAVFQSSVFASSETIITLIILVMIALMVVIKNNFKAFFITQLIMLAGFVMSLIATLLFINKRLDMFMWTTLIGLGLYMVYIPYNSILFDRLLAAFHVKGNVGFLIYLADSFGYLGSVLVLLSKSVFKLQFNWLSFYLQLVLIAGIIGIAMVCVSMYYFTRKEKLRKAIAHTDDIG